LDACFDFNGLTRWIIYVLITSVILQFIVKLKSNVMAERQKVVISQSSVTAGQLADQFRMIKDGTIGFEEMKSFLEDPKKFLKKESALAGKISPPTAIRAVNILGAEKVFDAKHVCKAWNIPVSEDVPIRYSEATLREKARQNKNGQDWRLVFVIGYNLVELYEIMPAVTDWRNSKETNRLRFYYWDNNALWWKHERWAYETPSEADNYVLINFKGLFGNLNYLQQERQILKLNSPLCRVNPSVYSEAVFSILKLGGERIAKEWAHRSDICANNGNHVCVTDSCSSLGDLKLDADYADVSFKDNMCVSLMRKFDF
jgi:hypothetical protein